MKIRIFYRCALCGETESVVREIDGEDDSSSYIYMPFENEPHECFPLSPEEIMARQYEKGKRFGHWQRIGYKILEESEESVSLVIDGNCACQDGD